MAVTPILSCKLGHLCIVPPEVIINLTNISSSHLLYVSTEIQITWSFFMATNLTIEKNNMCCFSKKYHFSKFHSRIQNRIANKEKYLFCIHRNPSTKCHHRAEIEYKGHEHPTAPFHAEQIHIANILPFDLRSFFFCK